MSFRDCLNRGVAGGEMDAKRAERVVAEYDSLFRQFENTMGPSQADFKAADVIIRKAKAEAKEKRRVMQLQAAATRRHLDRMEQHRDIRGEYSAGDYVQDMISNKRGAKGQTLVGSYEAVRRSFRRELTDMMRTFTADLVGRRRNPETLKNMVREIFGEASGDDAAAGFARAWAQVSEKARTRFNAAGGHTGKREDWGLPQAHDTRKVRKATYQQWRDEILPRIDLEAMGRDFNDGVPFTRETIEVLMKDAYDAIRTDGYSRRDPSSRHGSAMYNRRADHRFFKFRSAEDWMAYNDRFGSGQDAFRVMMSHLDNMAQEISLMEQLGPNPNNGYQFLKDAARSIEARKTGGSLDKVTSRLSQADAMFDMHTGVSQVAGNRMLAQGASAVRQYLTSAHLGSAVISSVTDFNTQRVAAKFLGMNQLGFTRQLGKLMRDPDFRAEANNAGLVFENAVDIGNAAARFNMEEMHIEAASRMADFTIRASGLGFLTEVQRQSFGLEFMSTVARGRLNEDMARVLKDYGLGDQELAFLEGVPRHKMKNGLEILRAQEIEGAGRQDIADLYAEAIASLTEFAVPSTDLYGRAFVLGKAQAGTAGGEFVRSALQFKAFPITIMTTQISRIMAEWGQGRKQNAISYAAHLFVGSTLLGGLALQMKDASKGKDPRDMTDAKFWMAAMAQGGGLGIFGDFLFSDVNRFGGGIAGTLAGPTVGFANDLLKFTVGNAQEAIAGDDTRIGREFTDMLRRYTPAGSLWYLRLAYEREILDQIQRAVDPKAEDSFRAKDRYAEQQGTSYFAPAGQSVLQGGARLPDIQNAFGG